jgi:hypothetical protein
VCLSLILESTPSKASLQKGDNKFSLRYLRRDLKVFEFKMDFDIFVLLPPGVSSLDSRTGVLAA